MIRLPLPGLAEGERPLSEEESRYLVRVLRRGAGDRFVAFDPIARTEAEGTLIDATHAAIGAVRPAGIVATKDLVLVYGLAKGDKVDAVVRDATELGATRIVIAQTARSVAKAVRDKRDRWVRIAEQAARQSGRADPPAIEGVLGWSDALDRADADLRFCLDPQAPEPLGKALVPACERGASLAFAVGAEGGLTADEIEIAIGKGFLPASLGAFVLRTETVAAAVLGAVRVLAG